MLCFEKLPITLTNNGLMKINNPIFNINCIINIKVLNTQHVMLIVIMIFYFDKFRELRLKSKISVISAANKSGVDRGTLWAWEKGRTSPNESKIRKLAEILNVSVTEISDLAIEYPLSDGKISELADSWHVFSEEGNLNQEVIQRVFLSNLENLFIKFNQTSIIVKAIMFSMNFMFYVKDTNLKYITANQIFLNNTSSSIDENQVLGCKDHNFFSLQEARENEAQDKDVILTGKPLIDFEGYIPGTRKKKWGLISKYPILDSKGKIGGVTGVYIDITDRKSSEEIREMLELSLNSVSDAYCIREIDRNFYFFVSSVIERIMGVTARKYMKGGVDYWLKNCVHPDDRAEQSEFYKNRTWPDRREYRIIRPDGTIRLVEVTCEFQHFLNKEFMCSVIRDITEKRKGEEVSELLRLNVDAMDSVLTLSSYDKELSKDITKYTNKATEKIFGFSPEEFYKHGIEIWLNRIHPMDRERVNEYLNSRSWPEKDEYRIVKPDGKTVWIESTRRKKNFLGTGYMLTVSRDITDRKKKDENKELLKLCLEILSEDFGIAASSGSDLNFLNEAAAKIFGYSKKELSMGGIKFWLNQCVHPDDRVLQAEYLKKASFPPEREYRIVRPNGDIRKIRVKYRQKKLDNKNYYLLIYEDITEE